MSVTINHQTNSVEPSSGDLLIGGASSMLIDSNGNVGINGTPSASDGVFKLIQIGGTNKYATFGAQANGGFAALMGSNFYYNGGWKRTDAGRVTKIETGPDSSSEELFSFQYAEDGAADSAISWSEAMRIDASGNLLVGTTSANAAVGNVTGHSIKAGGLAEHSNDAVVMRLNRKSSDGDILELRKDGSTVGSISCGNSGAYIYFGSSAESVGLGYGGGFVFPTNGSTSGSDSAKNLGSPSFRWSTVYAATASINTSDRNEKQDIAELSDAEQRVAVAAKGLLRKFRWKNAVEAKGDDARIHFGIIAQDLQAAFAAEGLDASRYAMFCSDTWWEHNVEVPAIEAVAEVLDDDGNVVTEAVEAADAYTRTDTYDTQEKAPEGATERTRLGVRYSELLAFIIAAI